MSPSPGPVAPALPEVGISEFEGVRYLHLGTPWVQGAMRLDDPQRVGCVDAAPRHRNPRFNAVQPGG